MSPRPDTALEPLARAEAAVGAFCEGFDASVELGTSAAAVLVRVTVLIRMLVAVQMRAARRAVECQVFRGTGHRDGAGWLAHQLGCTLGTAQSMLRTAGRLDDCPATADALDEGQLSLEEAEAVSSAAKVDPQAEERLVERAKKNHDLGKTRERSAKVRNATKSAADEAARQARLRAGRRFGEFTDEDAMTGVSGRFMPADYAAVKATIDAFQKAIFDQARRNGHHHDSPAAHRADAVVAMAAAAASTIGMAGGGAAPGGAGAPGPDPAGSGPDAPPGAPTGPAAAPAGSSGPAGPFGPSPSKVDWNAVVLVDAIALARGHVAAGETCRIPGVGDVSLEWVKSILPTSIVDVLVHDGVDITTYASMTRYTPRPITVAVKVRDNFRCVIAGCTRNRRVERDHRDDFADTFDTSYGNLGLLCDFHHDQKTHRGARLERHGDEWWWYPPPTGTSPVEPSRSPVGDALTRFNLDHPPGAPPEPPRATPDEPDEPRLFGDVA